MAKHTLLVSIALISSIITLLVLVVRMFFGEKSQTSYLLYLSFHFLLTIDACINCLCLILQFSFYNKVFELLCMHGHKWCTHLFVKHTVAQLIQVQSNHSQVLEVQTHHPQNSQSVSKDATLK